MSPMYRLLRPVAVLIVRLLYPLRIQGREHIPQNGSAVLACNHVIWADPLMLAMATRRQIHYMAKVELFKYKALAGLLKSVGVFPIKRGFADLGAIKHALTLLREGQLVGVFPEGTRSHRGDTGAFLNGASMLALKSGAPLVPAVLSGRMTILRKSTLTIGKPLPLEAFRGVKPDSETLDQVSRMLKEHIETGLSQTHSV